MRSRRNAKCSKEIFRNVGIIKRAIEKIDRTVIIFSVAFFFVQILFKIEKEYRFITRNQLFYDTSLFLFFNFKDEVDSSKWEQNRHYRSRSVKNK